MTSETGETKRTILVVDDETEVRETLVKSLDFFGYNVIAAPDGLSALDTYQTAQPDLVISDVYMPGMTGVHLLRSIRRMDSNAKVILITGYSHYKQLVYDEGSRPDGYFEKPFEIATLIREVKRLIGPTGPFFFEERAPTPAAPELDEDELRASEERL